MWNESTGVLYQNLTHYLRSENEVNENEIGNIIRRANNSICQNTLPFLVFEWISWAWYEVKTNVFCNCTHPNPLHIHNTYTQLILCETDIICKTKKLIKAAKYALVFVISLNTGSSRPLFKPSKEYVLFLHYQSPNDMTDKQTQTLWNESLVSFAST